MDISLYQHEVLKLNDILHHHLSHILKNEFALFHITDIQFQLLNQLMQRDGATIGELAKELHVDAGNMSSYCKKMETASYLLRIKDELDERIVHLHLSQKGKECVQVINEHLSTYYQQQWETFNEQDKEMIIHGLIKLNQFFESFHRKDDKQ